ncbi:MAG: glycoside hydrolase family 36 protein, partial [Anaerolineae bacterium]|nr:glycoside hydrolase family 36 protein [Anaerolineae bacterium]
SRMRLFKNGYQSWSETRSFGIDDREPRAIMRWFDVLQANARNRASGKKGDFTSETFTLIKNHDRGLSLLAGQQNPLRQYLSFRTTFNPDSTARNVFAVRMTWDFCGKAFLPEESLDLDPVIFMVDEEETQLLDNYLATLKPGGLKDRALPSGWCSWYYYYANVTQENITENAQIASEHEVDWQFFVLDDGYQRSLGDWLMVNEKFTNGLKTIADHIRGAHMQPGIWTAPFVTMKDSRLAQDHPEWLLKQPFNDNPVVCGFNPNWGKGFAFYALDVTHPGMQAYLKEVYTTLVHTFGFEFLKLDFVYAASLPGRPFDPSISGAERLNLGYRLIRDAAGRGTFILGCGSPLTPAIGMVDAMRIGPDVSPYWSDWLRETLLSDANALSTKVAVRSILNRCQMHRQWWINDPDCLMIRDSETKLSHDERFALINAAIITAGMGVFSDDLAKLSDETFATIAHIKALADACDKGRPYALDFMERPMPEMIYNDAGYLALFNFTDEDAPKILHLTGKLRKILPEGAKLVDVWKQTIITVQGERFSLGKFPAHSSRLFRIVE